MPFRCINRLKVFPPDNVIFFRLQCLTISCTLSEAEEFFAGIAFSPECLVDWYTSYTNRLNNVPPSTKINVHLRAVEGSNF